MVFNLIFVVRGSGSSKKPWNLGIWRQTTAAMVSTVWCLFISAAHASSITITLHEDLLNRAIANTHPYSFQKRFEGSIDTGLLDVPYTFTPTITIHSLKLRIQDEHITLAARINVQDGDFSYTDMVSGRAVPSVVDDRIRISIEVLKMTIYVNPAGLGRVDIGQTDISNSLPMDMRYLEIDVSKEVFPVRVTARDVVRVGLENPSLSVGDGALTIEGNIVLRQR